MRRWYTKTCHLECLLSIVISLRCPCRLGKGFWKWSTGPNLDAPSGRPIWVFPGPIFLIRFKSYSQHPKAEARRPTVEQLATNPNAYRRVNFSFEYKSTIRTKTVEVLKDLDSFACFISQNVVETTTICNIKSGYKLFAEYAKTYGGGSVER